MKCARLAAGERLRLDGLPERDPESVDVPRDELTHPVESIMGVFHDLHAVLEPPVQVIDIVSQYVQVDFTTVLRAWFSTCLKHDLRCFRRSASPS